MLFRFATPPVKCISFRDQQRFRQEQAGSIVMVSEDAIVIVVELGQHVLNKFNNSNKDYDSWDILNWMRY